MAIATLYHHLPCDNFFSFEGGGQIASTLEYGMKSWCTLDACRLSFFCTG